MSAFSKTRRALLLAGAGSAVGTLAGCFSTIALLDGSGPSAPAPTYRAGDRWVYRASDGFRSPVVWDETREVTGVDAGGVAVRVTQRGPAVNNTRMEQWAAPGLVKTGALFDEETRRFEEPLRRYEFPLTPGRTWNQWVYNYNEGTQRRGQINYYVRVGGWRRIATPAGSYDAVLMNRIMHLDDDEFWREGTHCTYLAWYAPDVRALVREEKEAYYYEKAAKLDTGPIRSQHALLELVSHTPGPG